MNEMIKVNYAAERPTVSARDLYGVLEIKERFSAWAERLLNYFGNEEMTSVLIPTEVQNNGGIQVRELQDYIVSVDTAKHICLMSRTEKGKQCRQYLIDLEKAWNTPEQIFARALKMADKTIAKLKADNSILLADNERMKPKEEFFDAVTDSKDAIEIGKVAKVLDYPGVGRNKLFEILRDKDVLMRDNIPYQKYIDNGCFRTIEQRYTVPDGETRISIKTLVYQKGVDYIRKILDS